MQLLDDIDAFKGVKNALRRIDDVNLRIEHMDVHCDGCEMEPILGDRCCPTSLISNSSSIIATPQEARVVLDAHPPGIYPLSEIVANMSLNALETTVATS